MPYAAVQEDRADGGDDRRWRSRRRRCPRSHVDRTTSATRDHDGQTRWLACGYRCETFLSHPDPGQPVIAAEGEQHPAGRGDRGQAAERHRDGDAGGQQAAELAEVGFEDVDDRDAAAEVVLLAAEVLSSRTSAGTASSVRSAWQRDQQDVADDRGDGDRQEDAPRAARPGPDGLLGHVGGGVIARVGPLRLQEASRRTPDDG